MMCKTLDIITLSHVYGVESAFFNLLTQTWLEEEDKEEGANERGKQHHQGC
jgi:hypothetical protein